MHSWDLAHRPWDPLTRLTAATSDIVTSMLLGVSVGPVEAYKQILSSSAISPKPHSSTLKQSRSVASRVGSGIGDTVVAGLKSPVSYTYGLARGFPTRSCIIRGNNCTRSG